MGEDANAETLELCEKSISENNVWLGSEIYRPVFLLGLETVTIDICPMEQLILLVEGLKKVH